MDEKLYVIRAAKGDADRYARIMNSTLQDRRLSLRARGLLALVLSMPPSWEHSAEKVAAETREGVDAVRAALRELVEAGYARLQAMRGRDGRMVSRWYFWEVPADAASPDAKNPDPVPPDAILPGAGQPGAGQPGAGQPRPGKARALETTINETTVLETTGKKQRGVRLPAAAAPALPGLESSLTPTPTLKPERARDPLFDALAAACDLVLSQMTRRERAACGTALAEIRAAMPTVTPDEIARRVANFRRGNRPEWKPTPAKIAGSWSQLGGTAPGAAPDTHGPNGPHADLYKIF
mgnify:CR=1 FL=1